MVSLPRSTMFDSCGSAAGCCWLVSSSVFFFLSLLLLNGWLSLLPSRYKAQAFKPSCQLSMYESAISSTEASCGRLIVFEIAPLRKGCAAAIILMWPCACIYLSPFLPHLLAQS